jgi:glucose/arabinose dehydrogenase
MRFHASKKSPPTFRNPIFIAERGSRNRGRKSGYRIMLVRLDNGEPVSQKPFATSWLQGETPSGRPLDVQMAPDGSLPVSDDFAGGAI